MKQTLGMRIAQKRREKAAREQRDIRPVDVAEAAGISRAAVSRYESGLDTPRDRTLDRIAAYLNTTSAYLRYGVGESEGTFMVGPIAIPVDSIVDATEQARTAYDAQRGEDPKARPREARPVRKRRKSNGR